MKRKGNTDNYQLFSAIFLTNQITAFLTNNSLQTDRSKNFAKKPSAIRREKLQQVVPDI